MLLLRILMTLCSCTGSSRRDDTLRKRAWGCSIKIYIKSCNCIQLSKCFLTWQVQFLKTWFSLYACKNCTWTTLIRSLLKKMSILESYYSKLQRCLGSELIWKEIWVKDMIRWLVRSAWYDVQQNSNIPNTNIANLWHYQSSFFPMVPL